MPRHDERIAAVIARSGEHQHGLAAARQLARQLGRGEPGALHELRRRVPGHGGLLDGANVGREQYRHVVRKLGGHEGR